ncbi:MAG: DUF1573 domain-containing protein [Planctomycetota bacterium]|nr:MAG: DUF1573 domain-containing protein [Planctomycetota bacterium]
MRRATACSLLLLALAPTAAAGQGPRLKVGEKELDFGLIMHGQKAEVKVPLSNVGDEPLVLERVKPSCGCTVASYPQRLAPGEEKELVLTFDSRERPPGYQSFRIAIYSNDPTQRDLGRYCTLLALRGEVKTVYRVAPHGAYFGEVVQGLANAKKTILVTGEEAAAAGFSAKLTSQLPDYLRVRVVPLPADAPRKGVRIDVELLVDRAPLGQLDTFLDFETNITVQPVFRVMVAALVNQRIAGPPAVHFGSVPRAKGALRVAPIERRDGEEGIAVARLGYDATRLRVQAKTISKQRVELEIAVLPDAPPGPYAGFVDAYIDDPHQRLVRIPVYVNILPRVRVRPAALLLPSAGNPREGFPLRVAVDKGRITAVRAEPAGVVEARLEEGRIRVVPGTEPPPQGAHLVLTTTVPGEEEVTVPLLAP